MASFARGLVGHHSHHGHSALAAALSFSAPLPASLSATVVSRAVPAISGSVRRQLIRQLSKAANSPPLLSSASCCSSSGVAARTRRFFSSSSAALKVQPAKPAAAATPKVGTPSALPTQRLSAVPPTKSTTAAAVAAPAARGVVRVGGSAASAATMRQTLAEQLGSRAAPTLLYTAPSHFWYRMTGLLTGGFFLVYALGTMWTVFWDPRPGLASWVPPAFSLICGVMGGTGVYFILSGRRLVRSIRAVPTAQLAAVAGRRKAAKAMAAAGLRAPAAKAAPPPPPSPAASLPKNSAPRPAAAAATATATATAAAAKTPAAAASSAEATPVFLEIAVGRVLPLYPAAKLYLPPSKVSLPARLSQYGLGGGPLASAPAAAGAPGTASSPATAYERVLARRAAEEKQRKARQYEMDHLMTAPFRHLGQSIRSAFAQTQRAMTREGFVRLTANGWPYRLDVTGGWALENGRALDRLVEIQNRGGIS